MHLHSSVRSIASKEVTFTLHYILLPVVSDSIHQEFLDHRPGSRTLQTRLLQWPVVRSSKHIALSIGWCYAWGCPAHISTPVQRPRQPSDAWSTSLVERCIKDPVQTMRPVFSILKRCRAIRSCPLLHSSRQHYWSIMFAFFGWLSCSCMFHSDSRSTCVCCFLSGLLELTPSGYSCEILTKFLQVAVLDLSNWRGSAPVFCGTPKGRGSGRACKLKLGGLTLNWGG